MHYGFILLLAMIPVSHTFSSPFPTSPRTKARMAVAGMGRKSPPSSGPLGMAMEAGYSSTIKGLLKEGRGADGVSRLKGKNDLMEAWLTGAAQSNPTASPGEWSDDAKAKSLAEGVWEVAYAPHISTMQKVLNVQFAPIRYTLFARSGGKRVMISNVHYKGPLVGEGWLNTAGGWESLDNDTVRVTWDRFWWDQGVNLEAGPTKVPEGEQSGFVQVNRSIGLVINPSCLLCQTRSTSLQINRLFITMC